MAIDKNDPEASWKTLKSTYKFQDKWLGLRSDTVLLPNGETLSPFHIVEVSDSVNVVAINDVGQIILVEQFRHAVKCSMVEIPAGMLDPGETPEAGARRELLEETGHSGGNWFELAMLFPYASRLASRTWSYLAVGVAKTATPRPDHGEIIGILELPLQSFMADLRAGKSILREAGQSAALLMACLHAKRSADPRLKDLRF